MNFIFTEINGEKNVDVIELVKQYLHEYEHVVCDKVYYQFDNQIGNWYSITREDICKNIANYLMTKAAGRSYSPLLFIFRIFSHNLQYIFQ